MKKAIFLRHSRICKTAIFSSCIKGNGTRYGSGMCKCDDGYDGAECNSCASGYFEDLTNEDEPLACTRKFHVTKSIRLLVLGSHPAITQSSPFLNIYFSSSLARQASWKQRASFASNLVSLTWRHSISSSLLSFLIALSRTKSTTSYSPLFDCHYRVLAADRCDVMSARVSGTIRGLLVCWNDRLVSNKRMRVKLLNTTPVLSLWLLLKVEAIVSWGSTVSAYFCRMCVVGHFELSTFSLLLMNYLPAKYFSCSLKWIPK